jgi:hypothetical protein
MSVPQLHSIHLGTSPRREAFRRARQRLLLARGEHTVIAENAGRGLFIMNHSMGPSQKQQTNLPADCSYVLVDGKLVYPLKMGINTVGRFLDSDVFLCEQHISRRHCVILVHTNGSCDLHDTASRNGTLLNGQKLAHPAPLRSGDRIRLCNSDTWHEI